MRSLLFAALLLPIAAPAQSSTASYTVTFESTWSAATHPDDFPPDPHFSGLIGAAHNALAELWAPGGLASPGIESMAETGSKTLLEGEIVELIDAGDAYAVLSGGGIGTSPGSVSLSFEISSDFPFVSLVSMLAPSPDWFVGVDGLELLSGGVWTPVETVSLFAYDAGTDSGASYTSPDEDTRPAEPITRIDEYPFLYDGEVRAVGTFVFELNSVTAAEGSMPAPSADLRLEPPFPNPAQSTSKLRIEVGRAQAVRVELFNLLGRSVRLLHEGILSPGLHEISVDTRGLPRTVYLVRMSGERERQTRRLVVR